jgi:hypothetical protein
MTSIIIQEERRYRAVSLHRRGKKLDGNSFTFLVLRWRILFELTLKAQGVRTWTGLIWLRIGSSFLVL